MDCFLKENFKTLGYYVYRLVDPRNHKTFYVGKGQGNRVFDHVNDQLRFEKSSNNSGEDEISAKMKQIRAIRHRKTNNKVIHVIHRYGLTEKEAIEVEAALIDVYSELGELTNVQAGHDADRGMIDTNDLIQKLNIAEFTEPDDINYVIIKTKQRTVEKCKSIYKASRKAWSLSLKKVKTYPYVLSTINGIVKEVFEVDSWRRSRESQRKVEFIGHVAPDNVRDRFIDKLLPQFYRRKGNAASALYKREM